MKVGTVAMVGKPNVGKSTLMNAIVGQKVSIVSDKPQTTRRRVLGISTTPEHQIVFIDTPGIHDPHTQLAKSMVEHARASLSEADIILFVVDGAHHPGEMDREIGKLIAAAKQDSPQISVVLCMNKMDQLKAENVEGYVEAFTELAGTEEYMMTTATRGVNVDKLVSILESHLPEGEALYGEDDFTDQSSRFLAGELVREKILIATRQEIPHATAVLVEAWEDEGDLTRISASIFVEKASQKGIIIGKQGQFLKKIGSEARKEIEEFLGRRVFLELHVKVREGWRMDPRTLHELEYSD